jgi:hypothetical protein
LGAVAVTKHLPVAEVRGREVWRELISSGALVRALHWQPLAGAAAAVVAICVAGLVPGGLATLRTAALFVVLGVVFLVDDESAASTAAVPTTRVSRLSLRLAAGVLAFVLVLATTATAERAGGASVVVGVALEGAALLAAALAAAAVAHFRHDMAEPGLVGAGMVAFVLAAALAVPQRWAMLPGVGTEWLTAHLRWAGVFVVGVLVLVAAARE